MHRMLGGQLYENDMLLSKYYITNRCMGGYLTYTPIHCPPLASAPEGIYQDNKSELSK